MQNRVPDSERANEVERLYAIAPVGLSYLDTQLRFRYFNEWLARMNGLPIEAHWGTKVDKLLEDIGPGIATHLLQVINTGEPLTAKEIETETPAHPGESKIYVANYFPDTDEHGTVVGVSCVVQDITELRQAEPMVCARAVTYI